MVRTSTESQQLEDQHNEMVQFCASEGYDESDLIFVEDKGASAIKLNDQYRLMIEQVKENIGQNPDIRCFAVWELSRAFRNEGVYYEIKEYLLQHNVQFLCKNPYLKLLNEDGSLNSGMEVAMGLLATLAKQEMQLKKDRFHRAKKAMKAQGKFIGGRCPKYGYRVDAQGFIVIDEESADLVRKIFEMYSTGRYSIRTLYLELIERGMTKPDGAPINYHLINRIVADTSYIGYAKDRTYPQLISNELWEKCKAVREQNFLSIPKGHKYCFGSGIFKCSHCGRHMIAEGAQYRCWHHNKFSAPPRCDNGLTIRVENLDGLLWWVASKEHAKYLMRMDAEKEKEYAEKIGVLEMKIKTALEKIASSEQKKRKIIDTYIDGLIVKKERDIRLKKMDEDLKKYRNSILSHQETIHQLQMALTKQDGEEIDIERLSSLYGGVIREKDLKKMDEIVKKHIKRVTSDREWYGKERDARAIRENAQLITIETTLGDIQRYIYVARKYKGHYFWFYREDGKEQPLLTVKKIIRQPSKSTETRAFKKIGEW